MWINNRPYGPTQPFLPKEPIDLSRFRADQHLLKQEIDAIRHAYNTNAEALLRATKWDLRSFISRDYGAANMEVLGGTEGIKALQKALDIKEDGYFGPFTFRALIAFQEAHGLKTDAVAGPETQAKLGITTTVDTWANTRLASEKTANGTEWSKTPMNAAPLSSMETRKTTSTPIKQLVEHGGKDISHEESRTKTLETAHVDTDIGKTDFQGPSIRDMLPDEGFFAGSAKHAVRRTVGVMEGIGAVISGLEDLTVFMYDYGKSLIEGNLERKKQLDGQLEAIWDFIKGTELQGMPERVRESIGKEMLRIYLLPSDEQDHALGNFAGNIIGTLSVLKAGSITGRYLVKESGKISQAANIQAELAKKGLENSARSAKVKSLAMQAKLAKYGAGAIDAVVNGLAESSIWYGLQKSIRSVALFLKSSKSTAEKIQTVDNTIHEADEALARSSDPEQQAEIKTVKEVLEAKKSELDGQMKSETPKTTTPSGDRPRQQHTEPVKKADTMKNNVPRDDNVVAFKPKKPQNETVVEKPETPTSPSTQPTQQTVERTPIRNRSAQPKSAEKSDKSERPSIPFNPPKSFDTEWMDPKKLYRTLARYYHTDRNTHPQAEMIFKGMKDAYEKYEEWGKTEGLLKKFHRIARDPQGYIRDKDLEERLNQVEIKPQTRKDTETRYTETPEQFMMNLRGYAKQHSLAQLRQLAQIDPKALGSALLYKRTYVEILAIAQKDVIRARRELDAFQADPGKYLAQRYPEPFTSVDREMQKLTEEYRRKNMRRAA